MVNNTLDPELDTVSIIVESEPVKNIDGVFAWRITGRKKADVEREINTRIRDVGGFAQFTNAALVHGGPYANWYFAMGITSDAPLQQEE